MPTYLMLGKYSIGSVKEISEKKKKKVVETIEKDGGKVESMYVLLGKYDLAFTVDFPENRDAIKASVALGRLLGVSFSSSPAMTVEEFDKMIA